MHISGVDVCSYAIELEDMETSGKCKNMTLERRNLPAALLHAASPPPSGHRKNSTMKENRLLVQLHFNFLHIAAFPSLTTCSVCACLGLSAWAVQLLPCSGAEFSGVTWNLHIDRWCLRRIPPHQEHKAALPPKQTRRRCRKGGRSGGTLMNRNKS